RLMPRYVSLDQYEANHAEVEHPQYVGEGYRPFLYGGEAVKNLGPRPGLTLDRLNDRRRLMGTFDGLRRGADALGEAAAVDAFAARALAMITSPRARRAFDLSREPEAVRRRYGARDARYIYGNEPRATVPWPAEKFLLARRLVEAGVGVVTL